LKTECFGEYMDAGGVMAQQALVNCKRRRSMFFTPPDIIRLMKSGGMYDKDRHAVRVGEMRKT
jgi:hypothetical protein